jgi:hypothetical protein
MRNVISVFIRAQGGMMVCRLSPRRLNQTIAYFAREDLKLDTMIIKNEVKKDDR